jgi:hypothetical protein
MQVKEESIWAITNLSTVSSDYEGEFEYAVRAIVEIIKLQKIDNLSALLSLKQ